MYIKELLATAQQEPLLEELHDMSAAENGHPWSPWD